MELFRKQLSRCDVNHRLAVPIDALETFQLAPPQYSKSIEAVDKFDKSWKFELEIRKDSDRVPYNPRPEFRTGWKEYVRAKRLAVGDAIVFLVEQNPTRQITYRIVAQRPLRLFGQNIIAEV